MVCSNEPGYYEDGGFGIRIENLLTIEEAPTEFRCDTQCSTQAEVWFTAHCTAGFCALTYASPEAGSGSSKSTAFFPRPCKLAVPYPTTSHLCLSASMQAVLPVGLGPVWGRHLHVLQGHKPFTHPSTLCCVVHHACILLCAC
jgi:hypothetical protein